MLDFVKTIIHVLDQEDAKIRKFDPGRMYRALKEIPARLMKKS